MPEINSSNLNAAPIISIGMPVYNGEKYIKEALNSLLKQSFSNFELIISDNASTDATGKICQEYAAKDARIHYFRQSRNLGVLANFQAVLHRATGMYFMWAAHDDIWELNWLEQLHKKMLKTGVGMAFGCVIHIDAGGELMEHPANYAHFRYTGHPLFRRIRFYLAAESLGKANTIYALYKIEMRSQLNTMLEEFNQGTRVYDFTLVYSCLKSLELEKADNTFIYKRIHGANAGGENGHKNTTQLIRVLTKIKHGAWPFLPKLLADYLNHSSAIEKTLLLLFLPIKLLNHYSLQIKKLKRLTR